MKTQTININQLADILRAVKGATPITISALVDARARKTGNPYKSILKLSKVNGMTGADYEASVNRQRDREGTVPDFKTAGRVWGERIGPALVKGTKENPEKLFVAIQIQNTASPIYFAQQQDGKLLNVSKDKVADFLPEHKAPANQGTDKEIVYRNYALESIAALSIGGNKYRIRSDGTPPAPAPKKKTVLKLSGKSRIIPLIDGKARHENDDPEGDWPEGWDGHKN